MNGSFEVLGGNESRKLRIRTQSASVDFNHSGRDCIRALDVIELFV